MSWSASDVGFDLGQFFDHLRATKPPFRCPYDGTCDGKIYRSFAGIQTHVHKNHQDALKGREEDGVDSGNASDGSKQRTVTPSGSASTNQRNFNAFLGPNAQKYVDIEIDGKMSHLKAIEPLEIISIMDETSLPPEKKAAAILEKFKQRMNLPEHVTLLKANFRVVDAYKPTKTSPLSKQYIKHTEKSPEELDKEVEYDLDEEDIAWLELINGRRTLSSAVKSEQFEFLMDRLEKESHFQLQSKSHRLNPIDQDAPCCVCLDSEGQNTNAIIFCDMCNIAVHQECYGVPYIPEGQWLCRRCQLSPSAPVECCLCPNTGGAFKQTSRGHWCHVVCAIWVPEVHFANTVFLEPVEGYEHVPAARWRLKCIVCRRKDAGASIQCHKPTCYTAFHVTCAQHAGIYMKVEPCNEKSPGGTPYGVRKFIYCDVHAPSGHQERHRAISDISNSKTPNARVIQQRKAQQKLKIKKARRVLAQNRNTAPVISIPVVPKDRLSAISTQLKLKEKDEFITRVVAYWTLKRQSRFGVPLLKRLQVQSQRDSRTMTRDAVTSAADSVMNRGELKRVHNLRQNLEKARILCELARKRERLKRDYMILCSELIDATLKPKINVLSETIDKLIAKDRFNVFTQPVTDEIVPGYSKMVSEPMDLSTMKQKMEKGQYKNVEQLRQDYKLMISNCLKFNPQSGFYWKYGMRMQRIGAKVLNAVRKEEQRVGGGSSSPAKEAALVRTLLLNNTVVTADATVLALISERLLDDVEACRPLDQLFPNNLLPLFENEATRNDDDALKPKKASKKTVKTDGSVTAVDANLEPSLDSSAEEKLYATVTQQKDDDEIVDRHLPLASAAEVAFRIDVDDDDHGEPPSKKRKKAETPVKRLNVAAVKKGSPKGKNSSKATWTPKSLKQSSITEFIKSPNTTAELPAAAAASPTRGNAGVSRRTSVLHSAIKKQGADKTNLFAQFRSTDPKSPQSATSGAETAEDDEDQLSSTVRKIKQRMEKKGEQNLQRVELETLEAQDLVWAEHPTIPPRSTKQRQCWLPAMVISPRMPRTGFYNEVGDFIEAPPDNVLDLKPTGTADGAQVYVLVRFFDDNASWHWCLRSKVVQFNVEHQTDTEQLSRPKRAIDRKTVMAAFENALYYKYRLTEECPSKYRERFEERCQKDDERKENEDENGPSASTASRCTVM